MKKLILLLALISTLSFLMAQDKIIKVELKKNIIYQYRYDDIFKKTNVFAFRIGSKYLIDSIRNLRQECDLKDGAGKALKNSIVEILKKHAAIFTQKSKVFYSFSVLVFPSSDGKIQECFFRWNSNGPFLDPNEVDTIINDVEMLYVSYEDTSSGGICYCQEIGFGILEKDWDYILGKDK